MTAGAGGDVTGNVALVLKEHRHSCLWLDQEHGQECPCSV